jgi:hypothetical protein
MRPGDAQRAAALDAALQAHSVNVRPLPGISNATERAVFVDQLIDSVRRVQYALRLPSGRISPSRADPASENFDPLKAAVFQSRSGDVDEAFWLVFLYVHFGKHRGLDWNYARAVYGHLNGSRRWDWASVSARPRAFRTWLDKNKGRIEATDGGFGNHRKYVSLDAWSNAGTGSAIETYVDWVGDAHDHLHLMKAARDAAGGDPRAAFALLYKSMNSVASFGRTGRFDYLAMLGKLRLADLVPDRAYLTGATGPLTGARLLYGANANHARDLDDWLVQLDHDLDVGMQVIEDALCNWQKSPSVYVRFRG